MAIRTQTQAALSTRRTGDQRRACDALRREALTWMWAEELELATDAMTASLRRARRLEDLQLQARACNGLGVLCHPDGDAATGREHLRSAISLSRQLGDYDGVATSLTNLAASLTEADELDQALVVIDQAIKITERVGSRPQMMAGLLHNLGNLRRRCDQPQAAIEAYRCSISIYSSLGNRRGATSSTAGLAVALALAGEVDEAIRRVEEAETAAAEIGSIGLDACVANERGSVLAALGRPDQAAGPFIRAARLATEADDAGEARRASDELAALARATGHPRLTALPS